MARASPRAAESAAARSEFLDQDPGKRSAQSVLLQAAGLAALPPSEYGRVEQVRGMIATYGSDKTLEELRLQRTDWCKTKGRNGRFYSPLNMAWVDRADAALSGNGKPAPPPDPFGPLHYYMEHKDDANH